MIEVRDCEEAMIEIQELQSYTQFQFEDLRTLMSELTDRVSLSPVDLTNVLKDGNCHLYVMIDSLDSSSSPRGEGRIIGCATLCVFHSPTGAKASIEDVVVSSDYRGQHLGRRLVEHVLEQARMLAPIELHLTSNPKRVVANKLYQSLGFQKKETNAYQMIITDEASSTTDKDTLKHSITYLIGKERAEGNLEPLTAEYISRMLNIPLEDVEKSMKEMGI